MSLRLPHALAGVLCAGLAAATAARIAAVPAALAAAALAAAALAAGEPRVRLVAAAAALALGGWAWGSVRLARIDRSALAPRIGTAERAVVEIEAEPSVGAFQLRLHARVLRWGPLRPDEPVLLELPLGRAPPVGARISLLGKLRAPRGPKNGFDERTWLRRQGIHAVLAAETWRSVGGRGGLAGLGDRLHAWLAHAAVPGLQGERRGVLEAAMLGDAQGVPGDLKQRFRAAGVSHLLVVSGEHVAVVALGTLWLALLLGVPRLAAEAAVLASLGAYVLAVGPHPSVIRAAIGGALGSLAWLTGRQRDATYALAVAAVVLLAWNPYEALDAGCQLSFAAVLAIFFLAPPIARRLEGYPLPPGTRTAVAIAAACGIATAPICWFQFHQIPLLTVPANVAAGPILAPMLGLGFAAALVAPVAPPLASALAWANGWCAAYLAACARLFGGLPGAQIRSPLAAAALGLGALGVGAYAWRSGRARAETGLPDHRQRQAEDHARPPAPAGADR